MTDYERTTSSRQLDSRKDNNRYVGAVGLSQRVIWLLAIVDIAKPFGCPIIWIEVYLDSHYHLTYTYDAPQPAHTLLSMLTKRRRALFSDSGTMRGS